MKFLFIDNYDSFSNTIVYYFKNIGIDIDIVKNDESIKGIKNRSYYNALILSPGPGNVENSGNSVEAFDTFSSKIPVLGICLGHQVIGNYYGTSLKKAQTPIHGHTVKIKNNGKGIFKGISEYIEMACYNSLVLDTIQNKALEITAYENDKKYIMGIKHKYLDVYGVQFHPESYMSIKNNGINILNNFVEIVKNAR